MENAMYAAAVLGSFCDANAASPGVVTSVLRSLGEIDAQLAKLTGNTDTGAFAVEQAALMSRADVEVKRLPLSQLVEVHYNYVIPHGVNGHLRLEIPGTCWDAAAPLYLS
jgi:hypothetical protein